MSLVEGGGRKLGWEGFAGVYRQLASPLTPTEGDVDAIGRAIAPHDDHVLLLGVTPGLSVVGARLTAVEASARLIEAVWPGDDQRRAAVPGDWLNLPCETGAASAIIGDGSLNSLVGAHDGLFAEMRRAVRDDGVVAIRSFCAPEAPETLEGIKDDVFAGRGGNLHALKWRIAMALAAHSPSAVVPVAHIRDAFQSMFADRHALSDRTGWSLLDISTIDAYDGATHSLFFPTADRLLELGRPHFGSAGLVERSGYPLAERCPILVFRKD